MDKNRAGKKRLVLRVDRKLVPLGYFKILLMDILSEDCGCFALFLFPCSFIVFLRYYAMNMTDEDTFVSMESLPALPGRGASCKRAIISLIYHYNNAMLTLSVELCILGLGRMNVVGVKVVK